MARAPQFTRTVKRTEINVTDLKGSKILTLSEPEANPATVIATLYAAGQYEPGTLKAETVKIEETRTISMANFLKYSEIVAPKETK